MRGAYFPVSTVWDLPRKREILASSANFSAPAQKLRPPKTLRGFPKLPKQEYPEIRLGPSRAARRASRYPPLEPKKNIADGPETTEETIRHGLIGKLRREMGARNFFGGMGQVSSPAVSFT